MADPTAWAQARLPNFADNILGSAFKGAQVGLMLSEGRRQQEKYKSAKLLQSQIDGYKERILGAHKDGDLRKMNTEISNLARFDEGAAERLRNLLTSLDRDEAVRASYNTVGALMSKNPQAREKLIEQAIKSLSVDPDHPFMQTLLDIQNTPLDVAADSKQSQKLALATQFAQIMGLLPEDKGGQSQDDLLKWKNYELKVLEAIDNANNRRRDNDRLDKKFTQEKKEFGITSERFSPTLVKLYNGSLQEHNAGMAAYNKMLALSDDFEELERRATTPLTKNKLTEEFNSMMDWEAPTKTGGFRTWFGRVFRRFMGWEQEQIDALYTEYTRLKNKMVSEDLKPPVSDKDIALMSKGYPGENANAAYIASFLRGLAKSKAIEASYAKAKADHIDKENDVRGFSDYWKKNKNKYIADAFGISEEALTPPPGTDESNWSIPLGGRESRQPTETDTSRQGSKIPPPAGGGQRTKTPTPTIDNLKRSITERIKLARDKAKEIDPRGVRGILERLEYDSKTGAIGFKDDEGNFIPLIGPTQQGE